MFLAYLALQSAPLTTHQCRHLPSIALFFGFIAFSIKLLTAIYPFLAFVILPFYSGVYDEASTGIISRWGFLGDFGYLLILWSCCKFRLQQFWVRFLPAAFCLIGIVLCIASGYRSSVVIAMVILALAAYRDLRLQMVIPITTLIISISLLIFFHTAVHPLPKSVQRALTLFPGDWDPVIAADAVASNDFRWSLWTYWAEYYFWNHPWFGRGFGFPASDAYRAQSTAVVNPITGTIEQQYYDQDETFAITGSLHNGLLSMIDRFGIIGALLLLGWTLFVILRIIRRLTIEAEQTSVEKWLLLYIGAFTSCYFFGALRIDEFLPSQLLFVGLLESLISSDLNSNSDSIYS